MLELHLGALELFKFFIIAFRRVFLLMLEIILLQFLYYLLRDSID